MIHPSAAPISNVKIKRVPKVYNVIYNYSAGKNTMPKFQCTEEFTRKVCALLYYINMTTHNQINWKCPRVLIVQIYRLVQFHPQRSFCASLSVRVSHSGRPVTYTRQFFANYPGQRIYCCMPTRSTRHHTLLHNPMILHTKTFFAPACHPRKKYHPG